MADILDGDSLGEPLRLLERGRHIFEEYESKRDKGELFNLLTIIRRDRLEVMTHSPILAELLRPTGSHGHGSIFLQHFLDLVGASDFEAVGASVGVEISFGDLGRIDIVLQDRSRRHIFIENKIGAMLQPEQLERYQAVNPSAMVIYLTLNGSTPEGTDLKKVPNLKLLSYRDDIMRWLQACRNSCAGSPTVFNAIGQYRNLVRKLTQLNISTEMTKKLATAVLRDENSYRAYCALLKSKLEVQQLLAKPLSDAVARHTAHLGVQIEFTGTGEKRHQDRFAKRVVLSNGATVDLELSFDAPNFSDCYYGFRLTAGALDAAERNTLRELFETEFKDKAIPNDVWPCWAYWHPRVWDEDVWSRVITAKDELAREIADTLTRLHSVACAFDQKLKSAHKHASRLGAPLSQT